MKHQVRVLTTIFICGAWAVSFNVYGQNGPKRVPPREVKTELASITIAPVPSSAKAGAVRSLHLELKNISNVRVHSTDLHQPFNNWRISIRDNSGKDVPLTEEGVREREQRPPLGIGTAILVPGESIKDDIEISKLFDLSKPGVYSISAVREAYSPDPAFLKTLGDESVWPYVASEVATFEVLP